MKQSKSFGAERAFRQHILMGHGLAREVVDLRADVEEGFQNNEARASFPHLDWLDATTGVLLAAGGPIKLLGRNLWQDQTFDTLTLGTGTAGVIFTMLKPGDSNTFVKIVQGAGGSATAAFDANTKSHHTFASAHIDTVVRAVTAGPAGDGLLVALVGDSPTSSGVLIEESGKHIYIHYEVGVSTRANVETAIGASATLIEVATAGSATGAITAAEAVTPTNLVGGGCQLLTVTLKGAGSTATEVCTAVNAEATAIGVIFAKVLSGGSGTVLVAAETAMAGGDGLYAGNKIWVAGVECLPTQMNAAWTNTELYVTVPALTGKAATDLVNVMVSSNGVTSEALSGVLA